ncbi:MAG: DUF1697 domain-containing protein [Paracoccaceae bacterium]
MANIKILLLRGVNVSGANRLPMVEFREMLSGFGLTNVDTHVQSGNAVFGDPGVKDLLTKISEGMMERFGIRPPLFLMDVADYRAVLAANPYKKQGTADGTKVHIVFLAEPAKGADLTGLRAFAVEGEEVTLTDRALYLHTPAGFGKSALADKLERFVKVQQTARNQRSAESILALAQAATVA